jgi:hypothetical protein
MTTFFELKSSTIPYVFKSIGIDTGVCSKFGNSPDFPIDSEYVLVSGKFPLTNYMDLYENSKKTHTLKKLNNEGYSMLIEVRLVEFSFNCTKGNLGKYLLELGHGRVTFEKHT